MTSKQNILFESFIPNDKFSNSKNLNKKNFIRSIERIKKEGKKKDVFYSFSKSFKLNFNLTELKKYKKFTRIITIGLGGSILGAQAINHFLKKKC